MWVVTVVLWLTCSSCVIASTPGGTNGTNRPNLIMILVDDLGYANVGFHNPEQISPNINQLVQDGVRLESHYTYLFCSPTRSSFLSGRLPLHVNQKNPSGVEVEGGIDLRMTLISEKLKGAGYVTSQIGKWHCGAYARPNIPHERGFDHHLGFLSGGEDHFTQRCYETHGYVDLWRDMGPAYGENGTYSCELYGREAVRIIENHNPSEGPLFMYLAFHDTHAPYEALDRYRDPKVTEKFRQTMQAMLTCVDDATGNVTAALRRNHDMWSNTVMVWSSDNGGPQYWAANNHPLRGGKGTDFQGGVRVAAFAAGGYLPKDAPKVIEHQPIHVADWYTTFARLGGADPNDPVPGLPDVDGLDVWPLLSGANATSPRVEVPLSDTGLIVGDWKLVVKTSHDGFDAKCRNNASYPNCNLGYWTGPVWPVGDCGGGEHNDCPHACHPEAGCELDPGCPKGGCLFNIRDDPTEHHDLSGKYPDRLRQLQDRLQEILKGKFQTTTSDMNFTSCRTFDEVVKAQHGFAGPLCAKAVPHKSPSL